MEIYTGKAFKKVFEDEKFIAMFNNESAIILQSCTKSILPRNLQQYNKEYFICIDKYKERYIDTYKYYCDANISDNATVYILDGEYIYADILELGTIHHVSKNYMKNLTLENVNDCVNVICDTGIDYFDSKYIAANDFKINPILHHDLCLQGIKKDGNFIKYFDVQPDYAETEMNTINNLYKLAVEQSCNAIRYVKYQTEDICMIALKKSKSMIVHILPINRTYNICMYASECKDPYILKYIPENILDYDMCVNAIKNNGFSISCVPQKFKTFELIEIAITENPYVIKELSEAEQLPHMIKNVVENKGDCLQYVINKTENICMSAIINDGFAIRYIPHEILTLEMCMIAIKTNTELYDFYVKNKKNKACINNLCQKGLSMRCIQGQAEKICHIAYDKFNDQSLHIMGINRIPSSLRFIKKEYRTEHINELAVKNDGTVLKYIDKDQQTDKICEIAIDQNPVAILHVANKTFALCKRAFEIDRFTAEFFPHDVIDKMLDDVINLISEYPLMIRCLSKEQQTEEICINTVKRSPKALKYIKMQTQQVIQTAICKYYNALKYINNPSNEIIWFALKINPRSIIFVPNPQRNIMLYACTKSYMNDIYAHCVPKLSHSDRLLLIEKNGLMLQTIEPKYQTFDMCLKAIKQNPYALQYVDERYMTNYLCRIAIRKAPMTISYVNKFQTYGLAKLAVTINSRAISNVLPENLTSELVKMATEKNYKTIKYIKNQTYELCETAILTDFASIDYIHDESMARDIRKKYPLKNAIHKLKNAVCALNDMLK